LRRHKLARVLRLFNRFIEPADGENGIKLRPPSHDPRVFDVLLQLLDFRAQVMFEGEMNRFR